LDKWSPEFGLYNPFSQLWREGLPMCQDCRYLAEHAAADALAEREQPSRRPAAEAVPIETKAETQ
jgi:hypothetical protein